MPSETALDPDTNRKYFLDVADGADGDRRGLTFILNLHGGGSAGAWQRAYFPASDFADELGLVVATPTAATAEPTRHWESAADDAHLRNIVTQVLDRFGPAIDAIWLAGHSQGGLTSRRLLKLDPFFAARVDGWLSLSGGRLGRVAMAADFGPPRQPGAEPRRRLGAGESAAAGAVPGSLIEADFSFIYTTGEHEIVELPTTSPWAERYAAGARQRLADVVDAHPGKVHDGRFDDNPTKTWGRRARPGRAEVYTFPGAREGRVIADVIRLDKGHTEGLEPNVTRTLLELMVTAPGGKWRTTTAASSA